jgi:ABC-type bacteriocin/lantibiotic exporter with double-glycine peptidase domain
VCTTISIKLCSFEVAVYRVLFCFPAETIIQRFNNLTSTEFLFQLKGYETIINDDGSPLTAFQLHLLALARALIRDPKVLLWEEDVSLMDPDELRTLTFYLDQVRLGVYYLQSN